MSQIFNVIHQLYGMLGIWIDYTKVQWFTLNELVKQKQFILALEMFLLTAVFYPSVLFVSCATFKRYIPNGWHKIWESKTLHLSL